MDAMPIYVYETTDFGKPLRRFELRQSFDDEPLKVDPKTGEAVHRVVCGGYGVLVRGGSTGPSVGTCGSHSD
jgi:predicted nucleic acid-binding Zn ribbon protein